MSSPETVAEQSSSRPPLTHWVPVVLWAACISWFSSEAFSARSTNTYIDPALRYFFGELSLEGFRFAHTIIRKSAHFLEYALLGILMVRAMTVPGARPSRRTVLRTIICCGLYAGLDELHQVFVPHRTGALADAILDTFGASAGSWFFMRRHTRAD